jgi:hypothetical protein
VEDLLKLHDEAPSFQTTFVRLQAAVGQLSSSASLGLIGTASSRPSVVIEIADAPLSTASFQLLERLLVRGGEYGHWIRGISLLRCSLGASSVISGLVPLLLRCSRLVGVQLRDVTSIDDDAATALVKVMQETQTLLQADIDANVFREECHMTATISLIDDHRHAAAVTAVENIFAVTQQLTNAAVARVPGQKNRSSAAGRPAVAVRTLEEESAVLSEIMRDALQQMPNRAPYHRGMYSQVQK